jgi:hypothetical protein
MIRFHLNFLLVLFIAINWGCDSESPTEMIEPSIVTYSDNEMDQLTDLLVGNGITFHPFNKIILISKPSSHINLTGQPFYRIFSFRFENGNLCCEEAVPFTGDFNDYHPVFSPDGKWIYFNSDRPIPGEQQKTEKIDIWRVSYVESGWGTPEYLNEINTEFHESYPTLSSEGTLYFNSDRPGGKGSMDVYKSFYKEGKFSEPELIDDLNSADSENDLFVSPDEKLMILNRYLFQTREVEMYLSYNSSGNWSTPQPIPEVNKIGVWELTPTITPDKKYFLYEVNGRLRFIELSNIITL